MRSPARNPHDIAGASLRDDSGSIAIAGTLGSGQSIRRPHKLQHRLVLVIDDLPTPAPASATKPSATTQPAPARQPCPTPAPAPATPALTGVQALLVGKGIATTQETN